MIQIGCCTPVPIDAESRGKVLRIREAGFDYVEYGVQGCAALTPGQLAEAVRFTREEGLPCRVMNGFIPGSIPLVGPEADLGKARRFLEKAFPAVSAFGAETIAFGSGAARRTPPGFPKELARSQLVSFLRLAETYCEDFDISIAIEPLCVAECNTLNTVMDGFWLAEETNRPHIRLLADYYHIRRNREDLLDLLSAKRMLRHVHTANCGDRYIPREENREEQRRLFAALRAAGYDGTVSIEGEAKASFETEIRDAGRILREILVD